MDHQKIHHETKRIANECFAKEAELVEQFRIINEHKVYRTFGYGNIYDYAVRELGIAENKVYELNGVAKKCSLVPEFKAAIETGVLNLSRARRIVSVIESETSAEWIDKALNLKQRDLEKEIAKHNGKAAPPDKTKFINEQQAYVSLAVSIETEEGLHRLQDLLSQKLAKAVTKGETLDYITKLALEKLDPIKKAERNAKPKIVKLSSRRKTGRAALPAATKHQLNLRDKGQCTVVTNGKRCEAKRWLQFHHVKPVSEGGSNEVENLTTLCQAHHQMQHDPFPKSDASCREISHRMSGLGFKKTTSH